MRVPGAQLPLRAGDGRPQVRGRAPAGRISWWRAHHPAPGLVPARYTAIEPGRRRNSSSSTTTILAGGASCRSRMSAVVSSHCSASCSRSSTASNLPPASNAPAYQTLSTGLQWNNSSGSAFSQPSTTASCLLLRMAGHASSIRSAARAKSSAASAWRIASAAEPCCSYHLLARRCSVAT